MTNWELQTSDKWVEPILGRRDAVPDASWEVYVNGLRIRAQLVESRADSVAGVTFIAINGFVTAGVRIPKIGEIQNPFAEREREIARLRVERDTVVATLRRERAKTRDDLSLSSEIQLYKDKVQTLERLYQETAQTMKAIQEGWRRTLAALDELKASIGMPAVALRTQRTLCREEGTNGTDR